MSNIQLQLPDSLKEFLDEEVASKGYPSASDYVTALLSALQKRQAWDSLEPLVLQGLASPARPMTPDDWQELRSKIDRIEAGQKQP